MHVYFKLKHKYQIHIFNFKSLNFEISNLNLKLSIWNFNFKIKKSNSKLNINIWIWISHNKSLVCMQYISGVHANKRYGVHANKRSLACMLTWYSIAHAHKRSLACVRTTDLLCARTREISCVHAHKRSLSRMLKRHLLCTCTQDLSCVVAHLCRLVLLGLTGPQASPQKIKAVPCAWAKPVCWFPACLGSVAQICHSSLVCLLSRCGLALTFGGSQQCGRPRAGRPGGMTQAGGVRSQMLLPTQARGGHTVGLMLAATVPTPTRQ